MSGSRGKHSGQSFLEHFRVGSDGKIRDTQYQLASHESPERRRKAQADTSSGESTWGWRSPEPTVEREAMALGAGAGAPLTHINQLTVRTRLAYDHRQALQTRLTAAARSMY